MTSFLTCTSGIIYNSLSVISNCLNEVAGLVMCDLATVLADALTARQNSRIGLDDSDLRNVQLWL